MEDKDVINLIQHYRHDLMNHFQIVQGYLSMNKPDKAKEKLKESMEYYNEERKLMHVMSPEFILWVMQVNIKYDHIKLNYRILTEKKLQHLNYDLTAKCDNFISAVNKTYGMEELYEIKMQIKKVENSPFMEVSFLIKGENNLEKTLSSYLNSTEIQVRQTPSGIVSSFFIQ